VATTTPAQECFAVAERLFNSGSYFEAARYYRHAWNLDPSLHRAIVFVGDCCFRMGDLFMALQFFWEALLRNREDYLAWMLLGDTYSKLGRPELASPFLARALELNPTNARLKQSLAALPVATPSIQRYFEQQLAPEDQWTFPLDQHRTASFQREVRNLPEALLIKLCFFYREYLNPKRLQKFENGINQLLHNERYAQMRASRPEAFQAVAQAAQRFLERMRAKAAPLQKYAGPPLRYRFNAGDGAQELKRAAVRKRLVERKDLLTDSPELKNGNGIIALRLQGIRILEDLLERLGAKDPVNWLLTDFTFAISDALAKRDFEVAQATAFGEMEVTLLLAQPGLAESETLPDGHGVTEGAGKMSPDMLAKAIEFIEGAATPEEAVRETKANGWHIESIFKAQLFAIGPQAYILYLTDYKKAYALSRKMAALAELLPERLRRFPLRGFYRLQALGSLLEAASKLGLHEETIDAGTRIEATVEEMGPEWDEDLAEYPAWLMRLGQADPPEKILARSYTLMDGAYRALGNPEKAASTSAKISQISSDTLLLRRGHIAAKDCMALAKELWGTDEGLDGAFKFAYMALSLDERKYRQADMQFQANRTLAAMVNELALPRLELIHWFRALAAAVAMDIPLNVLYCLNSIAEALEEERSQTEAEHRDLEGAEFFYRKSVQQIEPRSPLQKSMVTTRSAINALFRLAVLTGKKAPPEALSFLERAIEVIENQREAIKEDLSAAGFGKAGSEIYAELIDLHLEALKSPTQAFITLERSKIRALLDQFARRSSSEQKAHPPARLEEIRAALADG